MKAALAIIAGDSDALVIEEALPKDFMFHRARTGEEGLRFLRENGAGIIITDLRAERMTAEALVVRLRAMSKSAPILVVAPDEKRGECASLLRKGATDLLALPVILDEARARIANLLLGIEHAVESPVSDLDRTALSGESAAMAGLREQMAIVARTNLPVLICGESGTGKEIVARSIHAQSQRSAAPFVVFNCAAIAESLFEAELFGHVRGAFTGAVATRRGLLEEASGGTLFLDEVGELAPHFQAKLLRVMQELEYVKVGDTQVRPLDVRFIYATQKDLAREVAEGRVREDFYYRINVFELRVPPLRERPDDVPMLATYFLRHFCREMGKPFERVEPEAARMLAAYRWPGNVRELQNRLRVAALYLKAPVFGLEDVPPDVRSGEARQTGFSRAKIEFERSYLLTLLGKHRGNIYRASRESGKQRAELYRMIKRCGLSLEKLRQPGD
jgi:DNA-binding NtrC family response regulator